MSKGTQSVDDIKRALAEQDRILRAAFERLDPDQTVVLTTASLERLAEQCTMPSPRRDRIERVAASDWHSLRC